ncbi:hypothetical protein [Staphylococcus phage vB_SauM-T-SE-G1]|nr:hypothetical protein [Staphylococcus phage vB_SauM-V1SA15]
MGVGLYSYPLYPGTYFLGKIMVINILKVNTLYYKSTLHHLNIKSTLQSH